MMPRLVVFTDSPGWHGRRLARAFDALGIDVAFASLSDCRVDLSAGPAGIAIPGFEQRLPDGVFVREIAAGSFEQVTLRLGLVHALAEWQVPVYNSARAIERSVDKSMTSMLLHRAGVPTPPTWVTESAVQAHALLTAEISLGHRVVLKPLFGSQGKGLQLLSATGELPASVACNNVYYLQRFVEGAEGDYRVFVIAGHAMAAMSRHGSGWVHNVAQGAHVHAVALDAQLREVSERAVAAVGMDYAGVDVIRDASGTAWVIEVNGIPAWRGLQSVCRLDIATCLAQDFCRRRLGEVARAALARRASAGVPSMTALQSREVAS